MRSRLDRPPQVIVVQRRRTCAQPHEVLHVPRRARQGAGGHARNTEPEPERTLAEELAATDAVPEALRAYVEAATAHRESYRRYSAARIALADALRAAGLDGITF